MALEMRTPTSHTRASSGDLTAPESLLLFRGCSISGTHPAIISMETFEAAQKEFAERYGVKIVNGIAQRASYFYHRNGESGPHPKHRPPQWSEERRKSHSEYFRTRECGLCRYDFSHFIECENCGRIIC